jgi:hypothetical protein
MRKTTKKVLTITGLTLLAAIGIIGVYGVLQDRIGEFSPIHWMFVFMLLGLPALFVGGLYLLRFLYIAL